MSRVRTWGIVSILSVVAVAVFVAFKPAFASSYEWIKNVAITSTPLYAGYSATSTYETVTSGPYYEYRTLYHSMTSAAGPWNEWTECRREGVLDGSDVTTCLVVLPDTSVTTTLYVRASTNFSGCGTWTPTPDEINCGGTMTTSYTLFPLF